MEEKLVDLAYSKITNETLKSGKYRKTLIHLHTPASYDFYLSSDWQNSENYIRSDDKQILENNISKEFPGFKDFFESLELEGDFSLFDNKKEFYSYLLLGKKILLENIEMVVVTDHNTTKGYNKLKLIIEHLIKNGNYTHCNVIAGVELSCADRLHVVVICEEDKIEVIDKYIEENLISEKEGIIKTAYDVLEFFHKEKDSFTYIAHINSSNLFNSEKFLSGGYRKKLLAAQFTKTVGIKDADSIDDVQSKLNSICEMERRFILDCDAHCIEDIKNKNMWIKTANNTTKALFGALNEYDVSVAIKEPNVSTNYIVGMLVKGGKESFLRGKNEQEFCIKFSPSLNSFIGGRGTGKSTILELIDFIFNQNVVNLEQLFFLSQVGTTYILVKHNEEEYIIESFLPRASSKEELLGKLNNSDPNRYTERVKLNKDKLKKNLLKNHLKIYKRKKDGLFTIYNKDKANFLNQLYDSKYSVNKLVEIASSNEISNFIFELFINNRVRFNSEPVEFIKKEEVIEYFENINKFLAEKKKNINQVLTPFNETNKSIFKLCYNQKFLDYKIFPTSQFTIPSESVVDKYDITQQEIENYFHFLVRNNSLIEFFLDILKQNFSTFNSLTQFVRDNRKANYDLVQIDKNNEKEVIIEILENFWKCNKAYKFSEFINNELDNMDFYSVLFNVNAFEKNSKKEQFKDISILSLGQKVVAMLTIIFKYGDYYQEVKPIIIDQPEDNLDNRYIYSSLVNQLKNLKEKRQVIIATHNATIVINSLVENVIVMESDGKNGWAKNSGYALNKKVKKDILEILEGGQASFFHRQMIYQDIFTK